MPNPNQLDPSLSMITPEPTHGERRLGLLTSSKASIIMRGSRKAWEALRVSLWSETAESFDQKVTTGARGWGHEHEPEGVAKFWERHPEYEVEDGGFHPYDRPGHPLHGWLGSSPDRKLIPLERHKVKGRVALIHGLEVKSPTSPETYETHRVAFHNDQCQHGMLCTGWPGWWLVVHHGALYKEHFIEPDPVWQETYLRRATAFWNFVYEDKPVKRRRLSAADL